MKRFKMVATMFIVGLVALAFSSSVEADNRNKSTTVRFNEPVEIPGGIVLPTGIYTFKLHSSPANRHIVQIFNEDQKHIATVLTIPNYRYRATDKTVMTFGERAVGLPQAIRAWFYPGAQWGEEFVYPKRRAVELARESNLPVLAMPSELEPFLTRTEEKPLVDAPLTAVTPSGEEVELAEVVESPPAETEYRAERLPATAGSLPLLGLVGLLSLGGGLALWFALKRA